MKRLFAILFIAAVVWVATGVFFVQPDEIVLVRRCGRLLSIPRAPGAHFGFPWGIDAIERLRPREMKRVTVATMSFAGEASGQSSVPYLTADRNLVQVRATVQYTVTDLHQFVRQSEIIDSLVARAAEAALGEALAGRGVDQVLTRGQNEVAVLAREKLVEALRPYEIGVSIRSIELASLEPPPEVAAAFADVITAQRTREQTVHEAHSYASETVAAAGASARRVVNQARADRESKVRRASGEADRFEQILAEYRRAPELTARRIYFEALSETLPRLKSKLLLGHGQQLDLSVFGQPPEKP